MKRISSIAVLLGLTFATGAALAHDDAYLDTQKAPNGGQLRMAGPYHYELVVVKGVNDVKENPVVVYVTDHAGQKVPTAGASGTATILAGKLKATATLQPDGDNRMKGVAKYVSSPDMKVVVSVTLAGKQTEQARFTPIVVAKDTHTDHKH
jgi:predicted transcriptional regulator